MSGTLVAPPPELSLPPQPVLVRFRADPSQVAAVQVGDEHDPLVVVPATLDPRPVYDALPLPRRPGALLRRPVVERLLRVRDGLPGPFGIAVLDTWRSVEFQQALLDHYRSLDPTLEPGYVSDPSNTDVVAPHTTGGAVDLTLTWHGSPLALGTDFDAFSPDAHLEAFEQPGSDQVVRDLRRFLSSHMRAAGFSPYPWEWWHWSYGDQWWAADAGLSQSLFDAAIAPR